MNKIVIDSAIPYIKGVFEPYFDEVKYLPGRDITHNDVEDANAIVVRTNVNTTCAKKPNINATVRSRNPSAPNITPVDIPVIMPVNVTIIIYPIISPPLHRMAHLCCGRNWKANPLH